MSHGSSTPLDPVLYAKVKKEADAIYMTDSAYKSGWIVKTYKDRGGKYADAKNHKPLQGISRWFKEEWVDLNRKNADGTYKECGRKQATVKGTYPLCRPSIRVNSHSPKTPSELSTKSIEKAKKDKQRKKQNGNIKFL